MKANDLFLRIPGTRGAPSIDELFAVCPTPFKRLDNEWSATAGRIRRGANLDTSSWTFRSDDTDLNDHRMACILGLFAEAKIAQSAGVHLDDLKKYDAVSGWMLADALRVRP